MAFGVAMGTLDRKIEGVQDKDSPWLKRAICKILRDVRPEECKRVFRATPLRLKGIIDSGGRMLVTRRSETNKKKKLALF